MILALPGLTSAQQQPKTEEDLRQEAAIAEFSAKMKAANYPALFEQAATEFNVPNHNFHGPETLAAFLILCNLRS